MEAFEAGSAADGFGGLGQESQDLLLEMFVEVGEKLLGADGVLFVSARSGDSVSTDMIFFDLSGHDLLRSARRSLD